MKEQEPRTYTEIILEGLAKKPTEELVKNLEIENRIGDTRWGCYYSLALKRRISEWPEDKVLNALHDEYGRNGETPFANLLDRDLIRRWREEKGVNDERKRKMSITGNVQRPIEIRIRKIVSD